MVKKWRRRSGFVVFWPSFSLPHLSKVVKQQHQQSAAINLNRPALPAPLWLDVMISACHFTHWYVSPRDPSASLFCHKPPGCLPRTLTSRVLPRAIHSMLPNNPSLPSCAFPRILCLLAPTFVEHHYHLHMQHKRSVFLQICMWKLFILNYKP